MSQNLGLVAEHHVNQNLCRGSNFNFTPLSSCVYTNYYIPVRLIIDSTGSVSFYPVFSALKGLLTAHTTVYALYNSLQSPVTLTGVYRVKRSA